MSISLTYRIDPATRFLIEDKDGIETVITDLGGDHELTKIYIGLALDLWAPQHIGFSDLIEKEKNKGLIAWEYFLKQQIN